MILMSKLKIAAMTAGIILAPLGAGAYLLAGLLSGGAPTGAGTPANMASPAPIASTQPMNSSLADAGVIPFLNSNTGMLISFDLETVDLAAARARMAGIKSAQPIVATHIQRMADQLTAFAQKLRENGVKRVYMMLLLRGTAGQNPVVIIPLSPGVDGSAVSQLLGMGPSNTAIFHNAVVCNSDIPQVRKATAEPREDLTDALSATSAPMRVLYVPANFRDQHVPVDLINFGVSSRLYQDALWSDVKWCMLEITPGQEGASSLIYQCASESSAQALAKFMQEKADLPDSGAHLKGAFGFFQILHGGQIHVDGDRLEIKLDPAEVDAVALTPIVTGKANR